MSSIIIPDPATTDWVPLGYGASVQSNVPACRCRRSTTLSHANNTGVVLTWDIEDYDTDNIHDNTTNPNRLTARTAGKYLVTATVCWSGNASGQRTIYFNKNGAFQQEAPTQRGIANPTASEPSTITTSGVYDMAVGDFIEVFAYQSSGSTLTIQIADNGLQGATAVNMVYLGPGLLGRGQQNLAGTYLTRPAANTVPPGTTYFAIDALGTWLSDGAQWYLISQRPAFGAASLLTQAPWTTPYDGMEILITDSFSVPNYTWHFRYNGASSSQYKWEFIGGYEYTGYSSANQVVAAVNTWTNIVGSTIIPPRNGDYTLKAAAQSSHGTAGNTSYIIFWAGSVPAGVFGPAMAVGFPVAGGYSNILTIGPYKGALAGGVGIGIAAQNNYANGNFSSIQWSIIPARIS